MQKQQVIFEDIQGKSYQEVWDYQQSHMQQLIDRKLAQRHLADDEKSAPHHYLFFAEHKPVYTLGKSGKLDHLLLDNQGLETNDIEFFKINRGGDITYHGPGQITGYPILDLDYFFTDVHRYVRTLEEVIIQTLAHYGIESGRIEAYTGVWVPTDSDRKHWSKICAIGVHMSRWVTMHGFAFNVDTDLKYFNHIIPCGITDQNLKVISFNDLLPQKVTMEEVKQVLKQNFARIFEFEYVEK